MRNFVKILVLMQVLVLSAALGYAQTYISSGTVNDTDWDVPCSLCSVDYIVQGDIDLATNHTLTIAADIRVEFSGDFTIPSSSSLIVEEGCSLRFGGLWYVIGSTAYFDGYKLIVYGQLEAIGSLYSPIIFTKTSNSDGWGGIIFDGTNNLVTSTITYSTIEQTLKCNTYPSAPFYEYAGALYINGFDNMTVNNCLFQTNSAHYGGALFCEDATDDLKFNDCTFSSNTAYYSGGAVYLVADANPVFKTCIFEENETYTYNGGAAYIDNSAPLFRLNCEFNENIAAQHGGAIAIIDGAQPEFIRSVFYQNIATEGNGGAIYNYNLNTTKIGLCEFTSNQAENGGGVYNYNSNLNLINNLFDENDANSDGGALFHYDNQSPSCTIYVHNNTIANNYAGTGGGIFSNSPGADFWVVNTIIWDNSPQSLCNNLSNNFVTTQMFGNCDIDDGNLSSSPNANNTFNNDPQFAGGGDYRVHGTNQPPSWSQSPCIDAGDNSVSPIFLVDLNGNDRTTYGVIGNIIDIGAYENEDGQNPPIFESIQRVNSVSDKVYISPNITNNRIEIYFEKSGVNIAIIDMSGRIVSSFTTKNTITVLDCTNYQSGLYFVRAQLEHGELNSIPFIISR